MTSAHARTYAVVGGGISGLAAAYRIRAAAGPEAAIVIFDPADRLGGVLRTETLGGRPMDIGAEAFISRRPEVPALLRELGLADRQITPTGVATTIFSGGRLHPLPAGAVNGIPSSAQSMSGLVDAATIARIAAEPDRPLHWRAGSDPAVGAVVADRFGAQVVTRSVDPMLSGVYAGSAATIGIRSAVPAVAAALDAGAQSLTAAVQRVLSGSTGGPVFGAVEGGYRVLLDALLARSRARWVDAQILGIAREGRGWALRDGTGAVSRADAVVLALPAPRAAALLSEVAPRAGAAAARVPVASAAVLAMAVTPGTPFPPQSGVLVAGGERLHSKAITLSSRKWGRRGGAELLRLSFGRFGDDIARTTPDERLIAWALQDLEKVFGISVDPLEVLVHRWIDALPQYGPGHADLAAEVRAGVPPGLAVAGNFLDGVGVPACLAAAGRAAVAAVAAGSG
ncbi:protoporphyrinogen oxidase [Mycolicibacterium sp.]|uniref:protoporphyrinogen oxidase n=1 Tax=Mycolicibacterium sp. TaxID=2320850 RepID=UPI001D661A56|nr:protoporphyrinogen oxidase [Mycolicibacterium sp.]MCB1290325.1 protoporphyrinogen oxidase [Mycobacterium sp.]MCB9408348.1 protoporphyrinogen oxidase [Mycolicibacterium sp.]